jgi:hypothetical protein
MTINEIADQIIAHVGLDRDSEETKADAVVAKLVDEHQSDKIGTAEAEAVQGLKGDAARNSKRLLN